ncbi:DUF397 domain-containing protein [Streptomyces sp. Je 1-369]|uniref:DUF397 domain-containing protein n=1 Tax=Streptomyces sp. Je 1-369 TaxID=2966192 RepID=UPI002286720C|nr:DUF397 domain-containing protein [Streptomyces sp. Je 1-369]WAL96767.1 DUF397 domain-containing protein [Streptomyces sp. Je 1-369]
MLQWQKSSFSGPGDGNECIEVVRDESDLRLRESDAPTHILTLAPQALAALISHATHLDVTRR